jgi:hypothetical protein
MKYQEWKLIAESIGSGMTLGLSQPNVIGGPIGSRIAEEEYEDRDDVEESDEDSEDEEEEDSEGPSFPPEDSGEMEDEEESSCGAPKFMSKSFMGDEDMGDEDMGDEDMGDEDMGDEDMGDEDMQDDDMGDGEEGDDDMSFLKDIDPSLMGDDSEAPMSDEAPMADGEIDAEPVEDDKTDMHKDTMELMKKMAAYCGKYMKAEAKHLNGEDPEADEPKVEPVKKEKPAKKTCGKYMKHMKKGCQCEGDEFTNSLAKSMGSKQTVKEDALFDAIGDQAQDAPGSVGFAPQGRIGSIGGGYTKADFADIPVLGESYRLPTLKEWQAMKNLRKK